MNSSNIKNALTIDVEDYFQVSAFEGNIGRDQWDQLPCRVEANTDRILGILDEKDVKATFFMLGWVAQRYPQLVKRIVGGGHELASHGFSHVRVTQQTRDEFRSDIEITKKLLEDISGEAVIGFRAASFSIGRTNLWALDVLKESGYQYSSSIYPIRHDIYGMPEAPRFPFHQNDKAVLEIPISTIKFFDRTFPCGGGGYFRLFPYKFSRWALRRVNRVDQASCIFYFHPWELDKDQPRQDGIPARTRFRHYVNIGRMEDRLRYLLRDFEWDRMDRIFLNGAS